MPEIHVKNLLLFFCAGSLLIVIPALPAYAQQPGDMPSFEDYDPGMKGGINWASFRNAGTDSRSAPGFNLSVFVNYDFSDRWAAHTEITYSEKGSYIIHDDVEIDLNLDYVELPVLAKLRFYTDRWFSPVINAGPYVAFLLNSSTNTSFKNGSSDTPDRWIDQTRSPEWGWTGGVGAEFDIGLYILSLELRYTGGFTGVFEDPAPDNIKNETLRLSAGVTF